MVLPQRIYLDTIKKVGLGDKFMAVLVCVSVSANMFMGNPVSAGGAYVLLLGVMWFLMGWEGV